MNEYEAKQAARKARYEETAERAGDEANRLHADPLGCLSASGLRNGTPSTRSPASRKPASGKPSRKIHWQGSRPTNSSPN